MHSVAQHSPTHTAAWTPAFPARPTAEQWVWKVMQHCSAWQHIARQGRTDVVKPSLNLSQFNPVCSDCLPELFVLLGNHSLKAQMVPGRNQNKLYLSRTESSYMKCYVLLFGWGLFVFSLQYQ